MRFLLFFILALPLFAAKIVDYNIYTRDDRVDITFSFDTPYKGGVSQNKKGNTLIVTLNAKISKEEDKVINSNFVKKIKIFSQKEKTLVVLDTGENVELKADVDQYVLRLRVQKEGIVQKPLQTKEIQMDTKQNEYDFTTYILVMSVLILLLVGLWILKIYLRQKYPLDRNFNLIFQRSLDRHNQLVVFEYGMKRYTMVVGNSNIVLESNQISMEENSLKLTPKETQEKDFNSYFEENKQRLQDLLSKQK
ncbi:hypothetical protein [Campylobacter insulaenigrae]|uniref:hypothetical protein n=1 Tax=Campylobacter insulaenigrae TaxID=260714 RepID=UPI0021524AF0|nr:hypothetical protein [Campylobacter insulaenigrae]MCR6571176.1 hypothetical protein [Campylobacter insulaenigrae]MCR6583557.1 hypothetical protein [Campylobacter insulaenigrae]